jgi:hypothetical protein
LIPKLQKVQTGDVILERAQTLLKNWSDVVSDVELLDRSFIKGIKISTPFVGFYTTKVNHKLGRKPEGWLLCGQDTLTTVASGASDESTITLVAAAPCTVSIWIF